MNVRIGVIGIGSMGARHARMLVAGKVRGAELAAVCDENEKALAAFRVKKFQHPEDLIRSGDVDAVLIATPHYTHTTIGIAALKAGLHVLCEKPISVHKADCEKRLAAHTNKRLVFGAMFKLRTDPAWLKIRELVHSGTLGDIRRINWIVTDWFRSDDYYRSGGGWRGTWADEGGGVLINQCPHQLDLWQWIFGMPTEVWADCSFGKYHNIEVEDEVTATMHYKNGATAVFIASTGEAPGTNRLEIAAENGRLVYENNTLEWLRNEVPTSEYCRTTPHMFSILPNWRYTYPALGNNQSSSQLHLAILQNFVDAIHDDAPLITPASEGIYSVELANAMILSSQTGDWVQLPMKPARYAALLKKLIAKK